MGKLNNKIKYCRKFFISKYISLSVRISNLFDGIRDRRICGCSLVKYVPSLYRETMGATGSQATAYSALKTIFGDFEFDKDDSFLDVGCGKGRVLAYLEDRGVTCPLTGIELNADVAAYASKWAKRYDNITIIHGNAFELDFNEYTVLFLGRPFEKKTFLSFLDRLEGNLTHPVRFFYWWDVESGGFLENRKGWKMIRRGWIFKHGPLFMYRCPQRYTLWEYTP